MSSTTKIIHSIPTDPLTGSISVPVYQTATFIQESPGVNKGFDYGRTGNPTRKVLEDVVSKLENGDAAFAFATGLAAIDSVIKLLSTGDEIIAVEDIYGGAYRLFTHIYQKMGIIVHYVDTTETENIIQYINENTKIIWIESPTNPTLKISDIKRISEISKSIKALLVVDNTFASPIFQKPLDLGADIVIHSATKYLAGHSDLLAGLVVTKNPLISEKIKFIQNASGGILGPWDCFLTIRGIETANKNKITFLYEAAVCGGIPIIRNIEEYFNNKLITQITGIVNGSTNYILTEMTKRNIDFESALQKAKEFGFAESNPKLDIEGLDARDKIKIIAFHAFGKNINNRDIHVKGIDSITKYDLFFAKEKEYVIKLIATCRLNTKSNIQEISVFPTFIPKYHPLRLTNNEYNGILIGGELIGNQSLYGKGAGAYPTASAVLSDIAGFSNKYFYKYPKIKSGDVIIDSVKKKFYLGYNKKYRLNFFEYGEILESYE